MVRVSSERRRACREVAQFSIGLSSLHHVLWREMTLEKPNVSNEPCPSRWALWVLHDGDPEVQVHLEITRRALLAVGLSCQLGTAFAETDASSQGPGTLIGSSVPCRELPEVGSQIVVATQKWKSQNPLHPVDMVVGELLELPALASTISQLLDAMHVTPQQETLLAERLRLLGYL